MILNIFYHGLEHKELFNNLYSQLIKNQTNNSLLLIQNGVYWGLNLENNLIQDLKIYVLEMDLKARGLLEIFKKIHNINIIDYPKFVDLIIEQHKNITW